MDDILFSSKKEEWETPKALYDKLNEEFKFDHDPCPINFHHGDIPDGLKSSWGMRNYMNPPYGREIYKWIKKAHEESIKGKLVVILIPARTDTKYWHEYIYNEKKYEFREGVKCRFLKGRLKFSNSKNCAPFPSVIIIFNKKL